MKSLKNAIAVLAATSLLVLTGCKNLTPQGAAALTAAAVYAAGNGNEKLTKQLRDLQPTACALATSNASVQEVALAVATVAGAKPETKVIVTAILAILQTSTAPVGTNAANTSPYVKAVLCDGWQMGLSYLPDESGIVGEVAKGRNAPPGRFILVR